MADEGARAPKYGDGLVAPASKPGAKTALDKRSLHPGGRLGAGMWPTDDDNADAFPEDAAATRHIIGL